MRSLRDLKTEYRVSEALLSVLAVQEKCENLLAKLCQHERLCQEEMVVWRCGRISRGKEKFDFGTNPAHLGCEFTTVHLRHADVGNNHRGLAALPDKPELRKPWQLAEP
jgi:hypothetical protein